MATRAYLAIRQGETRFHLWRLTDGEESFLYRNSLPIQIDWRVMSDLRWEERWDSNRLTLAKALIVLEDLFGKSSLCIDDWKGSFGFPLLLKVEKPDDAYFYMLNIYDVRGSIEFSLYRIIISGLPSRPASISQQPVEAEFSTGEIRKLITVLYGHLKTAGYFLGMRHTQPFLRPIGSEHLIYGFQDGQFFEAEFESESEFKAAIANFETRYGSPTQQQLADDIQAMLQKITATDTP